MLCVVLCLKKEREMSNDEKQPKYKVVTLPLGSRSPQTIDIGDFVDEAFDIFGKKFEDAMNYFDDEKMTVVQLHFIPERGYLIMAEMPRSPLSDLAEILTSVGERAESPLEAGMNMGKANACVGACIHAVRRAVPKPEPGSIEETTLIYETLSKMVLAHPLEDVRGAYNALDGLAALHDKACRAGEDCEVHRIGALVKVELATVIRNRTQ